MLVDDVIQRKIRPHYITFMEFDCPDIGGGFCSDLCKDAILGLKDEEEKLYSLEKIFRGDAYVNEN